jgi:transposase-like protein
MSTRYLKQASNFGRRYTQEEKEAIIAYQEQSGLSLWKYCQTKSVGYNALASWKKESQKARSGNGAVKSSKPVIFHELPNSIEPPVKAIQDIVATLRMPNGAQLDVARGCEPALLNTLMKHLR